MALLMPTSANYFYEYLETLCLQEKNKDALVYFGLYADIRTYLRYLEEEEPVDTVVRPHALQILHDYVFEESRQWEVELPAQVSADMEQIVEGGSRRAIKAPLDANLFSSLYFFVLDVLEGYYKDF